MEKVNSTFYMDKAARLYSEQISNLNPILLDNIYAGGEFFYASPQAGFEKLISEYAGKIQLVYFEATAITDPPAGCLRRIGSKGYQNEAAFVREFSYRAEKPGAEEAERLLIQALETAKVLLGDEGVVCVYTDTAYSAKLRMHMDRIFGEKNFINEIIWHYRSKGTAKKTFSNKHDSLFFYGKTRNFTFNPSAVGEFRGTQISSHLKRNLDVSGRVYFSTVSGGKEYRYYEDELVPFDDVWDIPLVQSNSPEYTGISSQKPEELLKRILLTSTKEGDLTAELFAGSGSLLLEAARHNRSFVGIDSSPFALQAIRSRILSQPGTDLKIHRSIPYDNNAIISLNVLYRGGDLLLLLDGYSHGIMQSLPHYDDSREYLDYWAAGYIENDTFIITDYSLRTAQTPKLRETLRIPNKTHGAAYFADVLGNEKMILI